MAFAHDLGEHEGDKVTQAQVVVRGLQGGLVPAMNIDPQVYQRGDRVVMVCALVVDEIDFPPNRGVFEDGHVARRHVLRLPSESSEIRLALLTGDRMDQVDEILDAEHEAMVERAAQQELVQAKADAEARGEFELPLDGVGPGLPEFGAEHAADGWDDDDREVV